MKLKRCPCGVKPDHLYLSENGQGGKWLEARCGACGEWSIEFRSHYYAPDSDQAIELATEAWNQAPRGGMK